MAQERITELKELLFQLERKIKPLEWDAGRNQINEYKKVQLEQLKEQHQTLSSELESLQEWTKQQFLK